MTSSDGSRLCSRWCS